MMKNGLIATVSLFVFTGVAVAQAEMKLSGFGPDVTSWVDSQRIVVCGNEVPLTRFCINGLKPITWSISVNTNGPESDSYGMMFVAVDVVASDTNPAAIAFQQGSIPLAMQSFAPPLGFGRLNIDGTSAFGGMPNRSGNGALLEIGGAQNNSGVVSANPQIGQQAYPIEFIADASYQEVTTGQFVCPTIPGEYRIYISRASVSVLSDLTGGQFMARGRAIAVDKSTAAIEFTVFCAPDLNRDGVNDNADIGLFLDAFLAGDPAVADMNSDGILDHGDIGGFVDSFLAGCQSQPGGSIEGTPLEPFLESMSLIESTSTQSISTASLPSSVPTAAVDLVPPFGVVNRDDIVEFMSRYVNADHRADIAGNAAVDNADAEAYHSAIESAIQQP